MSYEYKSCFAYDIQAYISLRCSLGYSRSTYAGRTIPMKKPSHKRSQNTGAACAKGKNMKTASTEGS